MEREPIRIPDKYEREANASARFFVRLDYNRYAIDQYAARRFHEFIGLACGFVWHQFAMKYRILYCFYKFCIKRQQNKNMTMMIRESYSTNLSKIRIKSSNKYFYDYHLLNAVLLLYLKLFTCLEIITMLK